MYCLRCKTKTGFEGKPKIARTKNNRLVVAGKCDKCGAKKVSFIPKNKEGSGLLSMLGIKTGLSKIPILGDILF